MKKNGFEDKRLLEAVDHIDKKYISEALGYYDNIEKSVPKRRVGYILSLAACLALLVAAVPLITYLIPRIGTAVGIGTSDGPAGAVGSSDMLSENEQSTEDLGIPEPEGGLTFIEHVGEVPEEFKKIVEDDLFSSADIYGDILLTYRHGENSDLIRILDKAGNILGEIVIDDPLSYLSQFIQCSDGNFLAVVTTRIMTESGSLTTYIKLVKFDSRGKVIFNCDYQGYSTEVFRDIVEVDDGYIFIGIRYVKTTASKRSQIDIAAIKLSADGKVENYIEFGGNDHDTVRYIEKTENGIRLYFVMREQGEEKTSSFQKYDLDSHLNITKRTEITEEEIPDDDKPWFTIDGKPYYHYEDFFEDYDRKKIFSYTVIEYGDFVIAVYDRFTSTMTFPEYAISSTISPLSYYTERVYAAYTKQGKLIWRTAFDTSNYEFIKELLDKQNKN